MATIRVEDIIEKAQANRPRVDAELIRKAYMFSALHHRGQTRASGEPYLIHPIEVAHILADMGLDDVSIATGLLHDVVEDTLVDLAEIRTTFGPDVALLVDGLTKIANISHRTKEEQQAENVRKMVLAMVTDVRVVLIKLIDRLHNMRTMEFLKPEKRKRIAQETLDIYAPIAHRLGMGKLRGELEDLAFQNMYPDEYERLSSEIEARRPELEASLAKITDTIRERLVANGVPFVEIQGRVKRLYSLWKKLRKQKIRIEQVYDLIAARVITENDRKYCYLTMSVIHDRWTPIPERFKDWIAIPRDNLYQSLHTSVIGDGGQPFEVQIRTDEMHHVAEEGVAAHWRYKENKLGDDGDESFDALRKTVEKLLLPLVENSSEDDDSADFIESLKLDLYPKDVYTFTPMGKVIQLPRGSTPIDFAFAIHSAVGDRCTGSKINGRIVPLRSELQNGDVVEILTTPNGKPSGDWLNYAVTSKARNRIRQFISQQQRADSIDIGRKLLEKEADRFRLTHKKFINNDAELKKIANEYGLGRVDDLFASVGYGKTLPRNVIAKFLGTERFNELDPEKRKTTSISSGVRAVKKLIGMADDAILVRGVDNLLTSRANCCSPIRGDDIIGYISLGKGIVVHNKRCKNVSQLMVNKERIVDVEWAKASDNEEKQSVHLLATTENRTGMLAGITNAIAEIKTGIRDARANVSRDDIGIIDVTVEVFDKKHLDKVISAIENVPGVIAVERVGG